MPPTFADLGVSAELCALLARKDISSPFPIQSATLPDALAGHDVCGKAPTGSGKTLAYGLALALRTKRGASRRPHALVLTPTRELASQVATELEPLAASQNLRIAALYGGTKYEPQLKALRRGPAIVVATPGRLEDFIARGDLILDDINIVVVDEADRMADMGFLPCVRRILGAVKPDRQTLLFSATLDGEVDVLVKNYQKNPRRHDIAADEDSGDVEHLFWQAEQDKRLQVTFHLMQRHDRAIIFCRTRHGADRLARQLDGVGITTAAIHGNRTQAQRERALSRFKSGTARALVATDVAARGIHVDDVPCVVHFDPAADKKDYLHRSGRTGRAGADGTVVTLVGNQHRRAIKVLQKGLKFAQRVDTPDAPFMEKIVAIAKVIPAARDRVPSRSKPKNGRNRSSRSSRSSRNVGSRRG